jgi:hypothetical protein
MALLYLSGRDARLSTNLNDVRPRCVLGKILEVAMHYLIWRNTHARNVTDLLNQCSTPRDPAIRRNQQGIARASVCLMCALQNRVPKASARDSLETL